MNKAITKYIQHYQEAEAFQLQNTLLEKLKDNHHEFHHTLSLPCYAEPIEHLERLLAYITKHQKTLLIIVLNQPDNLDSKQEQDKQLINQQWLGLLFHSVNFEQKYSDKTFSFYRSISQNEDNAVLLIDRFTERPIPHKQGVGLARKIGADIALTLFEKGICKTRWLHNIDADVKLSDDYFNTADNLDKNTSALVYPFQHIDLEGNAVSLTSTNRVDAATAVYEKRLHQYQQGLVHAASPYAFYTIGSCIALSLKHYAQARGFPKQSAGEDFYLLNKLRKLGNIVSLEKPPVEIFSRQSARTPFGTGAAVSDILQYLNPQEAPIFYHPKLFEGLKVFIAWLDQLADNFNNGPIPCWQKDLELFSKDGWGNNIVKATVAIGFDECIEHCNKQVKCPKAFRYQIFCWFDSFKTLKWIHALRDSSGLENQALAIYASQT